MVYPRRQKQYIRNFSRFSRFYERRLLDSIKQGMETLALKYHLRTNYSQYFRINQLARNRNI